ncbi:unnamed protein product [Clavelina lepadiformis]|uniref:SAM domain-containing protein n=1 Tax=Clavelina lepadiformis TaxID=159417 RepID=A0ABP0F150_CLALP
MVEHTVVDVSSTNGHVIEEDASHWTPGQVRDWFRDNGYKEFETGLLNGHKPIDGQRLLSLTRDDLQQAPFHMTDLHEVDHLHSCIEGLRKSELTKYMRKIEQNGIRNGYYNNTSKHAIANGITDNGHTYSDVLKGGDAHRYSSLTTPLLSGNEVTGNLTSEQYPSEKLKTIVALMYMLLGFIVSVLMLQLVHERVPAIEEDPPLPDIFFDIVPRRIEGAFNVCETVGMVMIILCAVTFVFHKHRFIIVRRIFFILGTLYLYRSCTIYVTTLPVPGLHFKCAPKADGKISVMLGRAAGLLAGGGLSITGSHHLCGDYLFSGHTIILVLTYLIIQEYTPKKWWIFHWICWSLATVGVVCILLAHDHYTVDVVVAYILTTRLFWSYHTLCNYEALKEASEGNVLSRAWWFFLFRYFERNVSSKGPLPRQFEWPFPFPRWYHKGIVSARRSPIKGV